MADFKYESPYPWPHLGKVITGSTGTGTLVGPGTVLTASHLVETVPEAGFLPLSSSEVLTAKKSCPCEKDIALLDIEVTGRRASTPLLPVPLGVRVPHLPLEFRSCGYREMIPGEQEMLWAVGWIHGIDLHGRFQLQTKNQVRPGMSGAPVVVRIGKDTFVIGVLECRVVGDAPENHEGLAFATPLEHLPASMLNRLAPVDLTAAHAAAINVVGEAGSDAVRIANELGATLRREIRRLRVVASRWKMLTWAGRSVTLAAVIGSAAAASLGKPWRAFVLLGAAGATWALSSVFRSAWSRTRVSLRAWLQTLARVNGQQLDSARRLALAALDLGALWE
jgi:hypothetical protein